MDDDLDKAARDMMREMAVTDPLLIAIGRAIAPEVNAAIQTLPIKNTTQKVEYCPGCGEPSSWGSDLCPECLAVNADD
jgi:hypothetical protein